MTEHEATRRIATASGQLQAALHRPISDMTVPELYDLLGATRPIVWALSTLTGRTIKQFNHRHQLGGIGHDTSVDELVEDTKGAIEALDDMARMLRAVNACLEDAHEAMAHLTDTGTEDRS